MSKVDWSKSPSDAEFYAYGLFRKSGGTWHFDKTGVSGEWKKSSRYEAFFVDAKDYEQRPNHIVDATKKVWPAETRIDNIGRNRTEDDMGHYDQEREQHEEKHDPVNKPRHYYIGHDIQAIDIIKASLTPEQFKGYLLGNFLKYRLRAGDKGDLQQDIDKSNWYRERLNNLK